MGTNKWIDNIYERVVGMGTNERIDNIYERVVGMGTNERIEKRMNAETKKI